MTQSYDMGIAFSLFGYLSDSTKKDNLEMGLCLCLILMCSIH